MHKKYFTIIVAFSVLLAVSITVSIFFRSHGADVAENAFSSDLSDDSGEADSFTESAFIDDDMDTLSAGEISAAVFNAALIPVVWENAVFYDPERTRLLLGSTADCEINGNYFYNEYTLYFENTNWRYQRVPVGDARVREIVTDGPSLTLYCDQGYLADFFTEGDNRYLQLTDPKTIYETIVVVDPGHGGDDEGAVKNRVREKDINLDIVLRLLNLSDNNPLGGLWLLPTRTDDTRISLEDRYALANGMGDYFISVHNNVDQRNKSSHGTKTYYRPHSNDYPITSEELAQRIQDILVERLGSRDRGLDGESEYRLLVNTVIPTALTEVLFISNDDEFARLADENCRQEIAAALYETVINLPPPRSRTQSP